MHTITDEDLRDFEAEQESQFIVKPSELIEKVKARLSSDGSVNGDLLPWSKTHKLVGLRPGEVSLWAGINGHGKSNLLGQVCAWGLDKSKWLIASMEMLPEATMDRMAHQVAGCTPSGQFVEQFLNWTDGRLWIYDQTDSVKQDRILAIVHYAAKKLGVNHIVIDSLIKCGINREAYDKQAEFVDKLCWAAKSNLCHIHLVHHIRKSDKETNIPDKFDVRGAAEITDLVDNVFIIHRNKAKEIKIRAGEMVSDDDQDCTLVCAKQRNGEAEPMFKLWFHQESKQYIPQPDNQTMRYYI